MTMVGVKKVLMSRMSELEVFINRSREFRYYPRGKSTITKESSTVMDWILTRWGMFLSSLSFYGLMETGACNVRLDRPFINSRPPSPTTSSSLDPILRFVDDEG